MSADELVRDASACLRMGDSTGAIDRLRSAIRIEGNARLAAEAEVARLKQAAEDVLFGTQWAEDDDGNFRVPAHLLRTLSVAVTRRAAAAPATGAGEGG